MKDTKDRKWLRMGGEQSAVVEPRASRLDPQFHDPVIFCPVDPLVDMLARLYGARKTMLPFPPARVYTITHKGRRLSLVGPAMGAPAAAYVVERLIANKVRNLVMLGLCGSINPEVRIGDLVVPDWGLIEEGTSTHYVPGAKRSSPTRRALGAIREAVDASGKSYHLGLIWTTDAVFRETRAKVKEYGQNRVLAVEMEASALFTVARYRGADLGALLVVSDELFDLKWKMGFTRPRFLAACRHAGHIALTAAFKLGGWNYGEIPKKESAAEKGEGGRSPGHDRSPEGEHA